MHTLITFLGRSRNDPESGYLTASYQFANGQQEETAYFGLALAHHIQPDRIVMLGTATSMWDVLVEHLALEDEALDLRLQLTMAANNGNITQELLNQAAPLMQEAIGLPVEPHLIPMGKDTDQQNTILSTIAENAPATGDVSLDLTHGFRHFGMIGFLSGFMLERIFPDQIHIDGLWYGALDMTQDGVTPVIRLDGLNNIQQWTDAINQFEANGDYAIFAPLLERDGITPDKARLLTQAAFHEKTLNLQEAHKKLQQFLPILDIPLSGASGLFQTQLKQQLKWAKNDKLSEFQRQLATNALNRRAYQQAAILAVETVITHSCEKAKKNPLDHIERDNISKNLTGASQKILRNLRDLRNAMAHGTPPDKHRHCLLDGKEIKTLAVLKNEDVLYDVLSARLAEIANI